MIRKAVIAVLTLASAGMGVLWLVSYESPIARHYNPPGGVVTQLFGYRPRVQRLSLMQGKMWLRYSVLVSKQTAVPARRVSLGGFSARVETIAPSTRNLGYIHVSHEGGRRLSRWVSGTPPDNPAVRAEVKRLLKQKLLCVEVLRFPLWVPVVVLGTYPAIAFIRGPLRRRRRRRRGECVACGYNLTGNVSGVCPECGTEIKP